MNKIVVNTTNDKQMYAFFMPLVAMLWNKIIGYSPISLFVGNKEHWHSTELNKLIINETEKYARVFYIDQYPGIESATIAQVSRLYASAIPDLNSDDYLLTSDVDMFPLNKERFHGQDLSKPFHVFNSDAYLPEEKFAMCYLGGKVSAWREIMEIKSLNLDIALTEGFYTKPIEQPWNHDELTFYKQIVKWGKEKCQLIPRVGGDNFGRVDRGSWRFHGNLKGYVDSHLVRPGNEDVNWNKILPLLTSMCQKRELDFAINYRTQYQKKK
jgi:hypothetical protein